MPGSFDMIKSGVRFPQTVQHDIDLLGQLCELSKPGGQVKIVQAVVANEGIKKIIKKQKEALEKFE